MTPVTILPAVGGFAGAGALTLLDSTHPALALTSMVVGSILQMVVLIGNQAGRWARERNALKLAPAVYAAGGDAADVIRAVGDAGNPRRGQPPTEPHPPDQP